MFFEWLASSAFTKGVGVSTKAAIAAVTETRYHCHLGCQMSPPSDSQMLPWQSELCIYAFFMASQCKDEPRIPRHHSQT